MSQTSDDVRLARIERVGVSAAAVTLVEELRAVHGPLMFHQSGGCCDGSAPMCYPQGEFRVGGHDVWLGTVADCPFYISGRQFEVWQHTHLTVDVVPGRGSGFSLGSPLGVRFLIRSCLFSDAESAALASETPPLRGSVPA